MKIFAVFVAVLIGLAIAACVALYAPRSKPRAKAEDDFKTFRYRSVEECSGFLTNAKVPANKKTTIIGDLAAEYTIDVADGRPAALKLQISWPMDSAKDKVEHYERLAELMMRALIAQATGLDENGLLVSRRISGNGCHVSVTAMPELGEFLLNIR